MVTSDKPVEEMNLDELRVYQREKWKEEAVDLYTNHGMTIKAISIQHGVSYGFTRRLLIEAGAVRRPTGDNRSSRTLSLFEVFTEHLETYKNENGHLKVPFDYICADGYPLGRRVTGYRFSFRHPEAGPKCRYRITAEMVTKLNEMGFIWEARKGYMAAPAWDRYCTCSHIKAHHPDGCSLCDCKGFTVTG